MVTNSLAIIIAVIQLWSYSSCITLNVKEYYSSNNPLKTFKISAPGKYEIWAAGASGGGDFSAPGGKGGIAAGISDYKNGDELIVVIGSLGESSDDSCGGAGGGGATTVFIKPPANEASNILLLVGPGGGGSGYGQRANDPDYNDMYAPVLGKCDACVRINITCAGAAKGRDMSKFSYKNPMNYTYNPSNSYNYTRGCDGGYGGGGQGSPLKDPTNRTSTGGGGGGGGAPGGDVGKGSGAKYCSAGGPGKAYCTLTHCAITKVNDDIQGYFLIKLHELYKELPPRDRTNYERPGQVKGHSGRCQAVFTFNILIISIAAYEIFTNQ